MQLVEVFLPLDTGSNTRVEQRWIEDLVAKLASRFGGATAFTREPAQGLWKEDTIIQKDRIVVVEVMVDDLDEVWWKGYRKRLEAELEQEEILIRVTACRQL